MKKKKVKNIYKVNPETDEKEVEIGVIDGEGNSTIRTITPKSNEWAFTFLTSCISACNGQANRILSELDGLTREELKIAYENDIRYSGEDYQFIIELGELLKALRNELLNEGRLSENLNIELFNEVYNKAWNEIKNENENWDKLSINKLNEKMIKKIEKKLAKKTTKPML